MALLSNNKNKLVFFKNSLVISTAIFILSACGYQTTSRSSINQQDKQKVFEKLVDSKSLINLKHFNYLFAEIKPGDRKMAVIQIYSEYPDYSYAIEPAEGFACVDDVARAIVMLSNQLKIHPDDALLKKLKLLVEFVLYMQNANGYFNNFIWHDLSINTSYKTSRANINWWSFRALWSLQTVYELVNDDADITARIDIAIAKVVSNIKKDIPLDSLTTERVNTIEIATWLPYKYGADQAALAIISLLPYYHKTHDAEVLTLINELANGIIQMQKGDANHFPYGMFLSWKNQWHSWGNSQAYALLLAGQQLENKEYIKSALLEVDNFYPYILKNGFAESISIKQNVGKYSEQQRKPYPQIAYGIRPMVYATAEAFNITKDKKYTLQLAKLKSWLFANNEARQVMYDESNGRTYDAINASNNINMNSGAESTIEALLILQK